VGDKQGVVVRERDQVSIEKPVCSCRKRDSILDDIGPACLNRPNMGCLSFGFAASIDHLEPSNGACAFVSITDLPPKTCIANLSVYQDLFDLPLLLFPRRANESDRMCIDMCRIELKANGIFWS